MASHRSARPSSRVPGSPSRSPQDLNRPAPQRRRPAWRTAHPPVALARPARVGQAVLDDHAQLSSSSARTSAPARICRPPRTDSPARRLFVFAAPFSSSFWSQRHQPVQREHRVAGGHNRLVDRMAWVVAGLERLELRGCSSVMYSGAARPVRRATWSRHAAGVGVPGSIGWPAASARRWVQVRGTTWTSSYPPPPAPGHRPDARPRQVPAGLVDAPRQPGPVRRRLAGRG